MRSIDTDAEASSLRGDFSAGSRALFGYLGVSAQLATPAWSEIDMAPRLFVRAGVATTFDSEERIANEGAAGPIEIPIFDPDGDGIPNRPTAIAAVKGQGSTTAAETESPMWTAAIGVDLSFEALDRTFHVKPSVEWIMQRDRVRGFFGYAEKFPPLIGADDECPCRTVDAIAQDSEWFHGIGPGLEIEVDAGRAGPFMMTVFASGQLYVNLNRRVEVDAIGTYSDGSGTETLRSTYERNPTDYRVGWGLRVHWLPE